MSRASYRFGRALNVTFAGTGNILGSAADFFLGPGFGNSFRTAGQLTGLAAGAIGEASWVGSSLVAQNVRDGKSPKLIESIEEALVSRKFQLMLELAHEFSQREPQEPMGHTWQAMALSGLGQHADAIRAVEIAAQLGLQRSDVDRMLADIAAEACDFFDAVQHFTRLANDPDHRTDALTGRAGSYLMLGRLDEALQDANEAIATSEQAETYFVRAGVYRARGDLASSLADFNRADEITPNVPELLKGRAEVFELLGMSAEAAADRKILEAMELLMYLYDSGVLISLSPNGRNLELRGASVGSETMSRIAAFKPQLKVLLETG